MGKLKFNVNKNYELWNNINTWENDGEEWSKHFKSTNRLWNKIIYPKISPYLKGNVLEIAPGRGRMTNQLLNYNINLDIIDLSDTCIDRCKERFGNKINNYYIGNGSDLRNIKSNSKDFVFSFDSFVHMHEEVIDCYLDEIARVLKLDGYCFIHHANIFGGQDDNFKNVAGRSNMNLEQFKQLTESYKLEICNQELIRWDAEGNPDWLHDGFSLIKKIK